MNELLEQLKSKVGLDDGQAGNAVQTVVEFIKDKLPAPIASQVENMLGGGDGAEGEGEGEGGGIGDLAEKAKGALGGLLGGDK